jgi:long-chain-fatty-acid--CoA ligase ACSBG
MNGSSSTNSSSNLPLSTSDLKQEVRLRLEPEGHASLAPETVLHMLDATVERCADKPALSQKRVPPGGRASDVPYTVWTWKEYRSKIQDFAKSLLGLGFDKFDTINILGFNAPEWNVAHFGCMAAGGVSAGIYTTNLPEACQYISDHSKAKVVVVEGVKQLEKYYEICQALPNLKALVMYGTEALPNDVKTRCPTVPVYSFEEFLKLGASVSDADVKARSDSWKPGETCALIYTSTCAPRYKRVIVVVPIRHSTHSALGGTSNARTHRRDDGTAQGGHAHARQRHVDVPDHAQVHAQGILGRDRRGRLVPAPLPHCGAAARPVHAGGCVQ